MGSTKMDTYVEPEIEEVPGPMDEDDIMMDDHIGCDHEEVSLTGKSSEHLISNSIFVNHNEIQEIICIFRENSRSFHREHGSRK